MSLDRSTWEFINTFAPWLAAFATTAAVVVALVLARRASRTRLRVRSGMYHIVSEGQRVSDAPLFFQISVVKYWFVLGHDRWHYVAVFWVSETQLCDDTTYRSAILQDSGPVG